MVKNATKSPLARWLEIFHLYTLWLPLKFDLSKNTLGFSHSEPNQVSLILSGIHLARKKSKRGLKGKRKWNFFGDISWRWETILANFPRALRRSDDGGVREVIEKCAGGAEGYLNGVELQLTDYRKQLDVFRQRGQTNLRPDNSNFARKAFHSPSIGVIYYTSWGNDEGWRAVINFPE